MLGNVGFYALRDLGLALRDGLDISTFVETGTYKAVTTEWAADHFQKVITVEANRGFFERATKIHANRKNIRFVFGDSLDQLPRIVKRLRKPAIIWLDAHKCRFEDSLTASECPLVEELKAIRDTGIDHLILIDDARMFIEPPPEPYDPAQWPTLNQVAELLPPGYQYTIWNDAIIAGPVEAMQIVNRFTEPDLLQVVVLTSNKYVHCLPPFAYLFNRFWDAGQAVKVVRYDVRPPKMPGNFTNFAVGIQEDYTWARGLQKYLAYHTSDLILLMLEDYFIDKPVNVQAIQKAWQFMMDNPEVAKVDLTDDRLKVEHDSFDEVFVRSNGLSQFQTSLQAAIWRKDYLLRFLHPDENPWQFERRGTKRVIAARRMGNFAGLILGFKKPPLSYVNAKGGEGTQPGEWDFKKIPAWLVKTLREKRLI
jgi:hypothetical protein